MKSVCLAILNYNGRKHLEQLLPTAIAAAENYTGRCSVLVLDNRSTYPDIHWVKQVYPSVEVTVAPRNDFLFSYNWLGQEREEDILIFLNNDLKLSPGFVFPLVRHFVAEDVFAVTATSRDWNDQTFTCGPVRLDSHHGYYCWDYQRDRQELCHTLFCSGGFMAVDRVKFLLLDGFSRLFWPAYAEDLDLCFRAWRMGWRCIFEPLSVVLHRENGSWGESHRGRSAQLNLRASLLFQWACLPLAAAFPERSLYIALTISRKVLRGQLWWVKVWFATWLEWRELRHEYADRKISSEELNEVIERIAIPVALKSD